MAYIKCCYSQCTFTFQDVDELEWHLAEDHHKCYSYQCEQCYLIRRPSLFPTQAGVRSHLEQDHGLKDHYFRHLFSAEIDRKREKIRQDLDKCLKKDEQQSSSPSTRAKHFCEKEMQTEPHSQEKEFPGKTEKVPELPPEIAVIKVEAEDVEVVTRKICSKPSSNLFTIQQIPKLKRQSEEEPVKEVPPSKKQSTSRKVSVPACPEPTTATTVPEIKKLKLMDEISDVSRAADPRLRSQYFQSLNSNILGSAKGEAAALEISSKKDLAFKAASITIKLNNESKVSSEEDNNDLEDDWIDSSRDHRELRSSSHEVDTVDCAICGLEVESTPVCMYLHINSCHLKYELYTCRQCKRAFYGEWEEALDHLNHDHPTTLASLDSHHSVLLKDYSTSYFPKIAKTLKRYFPGQAMQFDGWKSLQGLHPSNK